MRSKKNLNNWFQVQLSICRNKSMKPELVRISKKVGNLYFQCQDQSLEKCLLVKVKMFKL